MGWSALGRSRLVLAGAIGASWILPGASVFAQQEPPADADEWREVKDKLQYLER